VTQAAQDLRNLINDLNADILQEGLIFALHQIIERQQRSYAIAIRSNLAYRPGSLTPAQELNLLRIVQEALTNACQHSSASEVWVDLQSEYQSSEKAHISVEIRDNGVGFDPASPSTSGWGLKNMQRRAQQLGVTLQIHSQPGAGAQIRLCIE
jgi:two-component system, NarL family, sensor kinase